MVALAACGEAPLEPQKPSEGAPHFRVATYNVLLNSASSGSSVAAIASTDADVIGLQEITPDWEAKLSETYRDEYPYMLFHVAGGAGGLGILSRYPLTDEGFHEGPQGWHPAWHVRAETPAGPVQILNVHLRSVLSGNSGAIKSFLSTASDHLTEIEQYADKCSSEYSTIVLGDFNEDPDGKAIRFLEGRGFRNALPLFHPGQPTWRHDSVANQLGMTIDHILFDDRLRPLNAWVERKGASDHLPVVAHFEPYAW